MAISVFQSLTVYIQAKISLSIIPRHAFM